MRACHMSASSVMGARRQSWGPSLAWLRDLTCTHCASVHGEVSSDCMVATASSIIQSSSLCAARDESSLAVPKHDADVSQASYDWKPMRTRRSSALGPSFAASESPTSRN